LVLCPPFPRYPRASVGAFDEALCPRRPAPARAGRLGCRVTIVNLIGTGGWISRLRRVGLHDRLARAIAGTTPALVLVLEGTQVDAAMVASLRHGSGPSWVNWFCDARRSAEDILPFAAAYDAVFVADRLTVAALDVAGNPPCTIAPPDAIPHPPADAGSRPPGESCSQEQRRRIGAAARGADPNSGWPCGGRVAAPSSGTTAGASC
jgi:hypothetical protein